MFLLQKNAPLVWVKDIELLMKSCFPDKFELNYTNMHPEKATWIAQALAKSSQESLWNELKHQPYSLHYDETSTKYYKYGLFLVRRINQSFTSVEYDVLNLHDVTKGDAESIYKLYESYITKQNIERYLTSLCLDNCNTMRGKENSLMKKSK